MIGAVPESEVAAAVKHLVSDIEDANNNHVTVSSRGFCFFGNACAFPFTAFSFQMCVCVYVRVLLLLLLLLLLFLFVSRGLSWLVSMVAGAGHNEVHSSNGGCFLDELVKVCSVRRAPWLAERGHALGKATDKTRVKI